MPTFTADDLAALRPCSDNCIERFRELFPDGVSLTPENIREAADRWGDNPLDTADIIWLGMMLVRRLAWRQAGLAVRHAAIGAPALAPWADNVTPDNWREAYEAAVRAAEIDVRTADLPQRYSSRAASDAASVISDTVRYMRGALLLYTIQDTTDTVMHVVVYAVRAVHATRNPQARHHPHAAMRAAEKQAWREMREMAIEALVAHFTSTAAKEVQA